MDIDGFSLLRHDRNRHGGGVALYVHNTLEAEVLATSNTNTEYLICSVQQGRAASILVAVIYRPPQISFIQGTDFVAQLTSYVDSNFSHKIIMGDLNANLLSTVDDAKFVKKLAKDLSLKIVNHDATHHKPGSHTWIDVIVVDDNDEILSAENQVATFPSHHNIIDVQIKIHNLISSFINNPVTFSYRLQIHISNCTEYVGSKL